MAILTLAVGVGANTAVFSVVHAVLLRPLSYYQPDRLVWLWQKHAAQDLRVVPASPADFNDWKQQSRSFEGISAWRDRNFSLTGVEAAEQIPGARVLPDLLGVLGVKPVLGREFLPGEGKPGNDRLVILTYGLWQRRFGGDPNIVGRELQLDGAAHTIVGIMPRGFRFPFGQIEILAPWSLESGPALERGAKFRLLRVLGRLKRGVTQQEARGEMEGIARRLEAAYPATNKGWSVNLVPLRDFYVEGVRPGLVMLQAAVLLVVLIACANVANLLLVRASGRRREMAVRAALGAGRWRLARLLVTESLVLAAAGGTGGALLAWWGLRPLAAALPRTFPLPVPGLDQIQVNLPVLGFTALVSLAAGLLFGMAPLAGCESGDLQESLKESGRGATGGRGARRVRALLVIGEVALAVVLSISAALVMKSMARIAKVDPGFRPASLLTMQINLPQTRYPDKPRQREFFQRLLERVRRLPGLESAGLVNYVPLGRAWGIVRFQIDGKPAPVEETPSVSNLVVSPGYFESMGIRLLAGRFFTDQDHERAPRVGVVNQALARRYFAGENPLGQRLRLEGEGPEVAPIQVVGVVGDVRHFDLVVKPSPELYRSFAQAPVASMALVARTAGQPIRMAPAARLQVTGLDPDQPVHAVQTMETMIEDSLWQERISVRLFGLFAAVALFLSLVGIFGLTSYTVSQRTREIGLRMAMGAAPEDVRRMVVRHGLGLGVAGTAAGVAIAALTSRLLAAHLFEAQAADPWVFAGVPLVVLLIAALGSWAPALRASRLDPVAALRQE